ncbi:hypothetical protein R3P38DRAFT_3371189 [Favolaschia claudopus]|uniref:Uncharacterized protein n=1 Tax=Favolaschia claudopus TaxID=2862362 RepID=A0AAV9ZZ55_9AGAR
MFWTSARPLSRPRHSMEKYIPGFDYPTHLVRPDPSQGHYYSADPGRVNEDPSFLEGLDLPENMAAEEDGSRAARAVGRLDGKKSPGENFLECRTQRIKAGMLKLNVEGRLMSVAASLCSVQQLEVLGPGYGKLEDLANISANSARHEPDSKLKRMQNSSSFLKNQVDSDLFDLSYLTPGSDGCSNYFRIPSSSLHVQDDFKRSIGLWGCGVSGNTRPPEGWKHSG